MAAAKKLSYDHYGLDVYETEDGKEWAVGTEAQANRAAKEDILEHLWAFNSSFIAKAVGLTDEEEKGLALMQKELNEGANALMRRIIGERNIDRLVRDAIKADGRGHFLSGYDSEERDSNDIEGLPRGKLAYRMN